MATIYPTFPPTIWPTLDPHASADDPYVPVDAPPTGSGENLRVTEANEPRVTEDGHDRVIEG